MIILSGVLVVVAIALLVTGIVTGNTGHEVLSLDGLKLIYISIGVSIVSALCLAVGVFVRRKELFGTTAPANASAKPGKASKAAKPVKAKARVGAGEEIPGPATSSAVTDVPAETTVYVVPGRKRYHLETCRQLAGRDKEELTFVEAHEEGFTACTACIPDTALAARAAITDAGPADTAAIPAQSEAERRQPPEDPAEVTLTDLRAIEDRPATGEQPVADVTITEQTAEPFYEEPAGRGASLFEPMKRTHAETTEDVPAGDDDGGADDVIDEPVEPKDTAPDEPAEAVAEDDEPADEAKPDEPADTQEHESGEDPAADVWREDKPEDDAAKDDDAESGTTGVVRILSGTKRYHRPDCALIEDIAEDADDIEILSSAAAKERGCTPCLVCQPDKDLSEG